MQRSVDLFVGAIQLVSFSGAAVIALFTLYHLFARTSVRRLLPFFLLIHASTVGLCLAACSAGVWLFCSATTGGAALSAVLITCYWAAVGAYCALQFARCGD